MKKRTTRILAIVMALCALLSTAAFAAETTAAAEPAPIAINVNGETVKFPDAQPYIDENNRTMVPVRFIAEALDANAIWYAETNTATLSRGGTHITITIGDPNLKVAGMWGEDIVTMDTTAVLKDGRIYLPIRFVAQAFGGAVAYDAETNTACIAVAPVIDNRDIVATNYPSYEDMADFFESFFGPILDAFPGLKDQIGNLIPKT